MKIFSDKDNRHFIILVIICLIIMVMTLLLINNHNKNTIYDEFNGTLSQIIASLQEKYPNIKEEEIIAILNSPSHDYDTDLLKRYGIDPENDFLVAGLNTKYTNSLLLNILIVIIFGIVVIFIYVYITHKRERRISALNKIIHNINNNIYDLDITENSEDDLSNIRNELYKTTLMLKRAALDSDQKRLSLKDSVADISHQLKTPLTSISILLDNIIEDDAMAPDVRKKFLKNIRFQIDNVNNLLITLLKLSRIDAGVVTFQRQEINLKNLIDQVVANMAINLDLKDIKLRIDIDSSLHILGDVSWEAEAIGNVLKNCIDYSEVGGGIEIVGTENQFFVKLQITDHGCGMSLKDQRHIFDRFYKGENSGSSSFGIGLSLARTIIEQDSGFISVSSTIGAGTTFTIKYIKNKVK